MLIKIRILTKHVLLKIRILVKQVPELSSVVICVEEEDSKTFPTESSLDSFLISTSFSSFLIFSSLKIKFC